MKKWEKNYRAELNATMEVVVEGELSMNIGVGIISVDLDKEHLIEVLVAIEKFSRKNSKDEVSYPSLPREATESIKRGNTAQEELEKAMLDYLLKDYEKDNTGE